MGESGRRAGWCVGGSGGYFPCRNLRCRSSVMAPTKHHYLVESSWLVSVSSSLFPPLRGLSASQKEPSTILLWIFQELPCWASGELRVVGKELSWLWRWEVRGVLAGVSPVTQQWIKAGFPALFFCTCLHYKNRQILSSLPETTRGFLFHKRSNVLLLINIFLASCFLCWPQCSSAEWRDLSPWLSFATSTLHGPDLLPSCPSPWTVFGALQQFQTSGKRLCTAIWCICGGLCPSGACN